MLTCNDLFLVMNRENRLKRVPILQEHSVARLIGAPPGYVGHEVP